MTRDPVLHTITFPYNVSSEEACFVIAHELLHELFYRYVNRVFKEKIALNSSKLWDVSEVFNVIIMEGTEFQKVFNYPSMPYPQHKKLLTKMRLIWNKTKTIDSLIEIFVFKNHSSRGSL